MNNMVKILAKITGIKYTPFLCKTLKVFSINGFEKALSKEATFVIETINKNQIAISWWVSAKRTRSYPYARVYDSLSFSGKKVTIIPILKDEGFDGDRDFLQWDTVSLMSLLGIYVILSYYKDAEKSKRYENKITNQRFDVNQIKSEIDKLLSYQSDALHWNLEQIGKVGELGQKALSSYEKLSKKLNVPMHSKKSGENRVKKLLEDKELFMNYSRDLAQKAQQRESVTIQPKEKIDGQKATITITNYLGGCYYFTCDEIKIENEKIELIEAKHSKEKNLPSLEDIKDGLVKMILFANLEDVKIDGKKYNSNPILKLTAEKQFDVLKQLTKSEEKTLNLLKKEAEINKFKVKINSSVEN